MMKYISFCLRLVLPVLVLSGCGKTESGTNEAPLVKVASVKEYVAEDTLSYPGKIVSGSDVNVAFSISGPIKKVLVEEGQFVKKGEVIAEMAPRDYEIQFSATKAEYEQVKAEAERVIELHKRNSVAN